MVFTQCVHDFPINNQEEIKQMSELINNQLTKIQAVPSVTPTKKTNASLRLVVSNHAHAQEPLPAQGINFDQLFTAEVHRRSASTYALVVCDYFHNLDCELILEVDRNHEIQDDAELICYFPYIQYEELITAVWEDNVLPDMIQIQFQMNILKQLLLFCIDQNAKNLIIHVHEEHNRGVEMYLNLAVYKNKIPTIKGNILQMTIPITPRIFDRCIEFMDEANQTFRRKIWENYQGNPVIRQYIKSNSSLLFQIGEVLHESC
jgi:hypothetical protein